VKTVGRELPFSQEVYVGTWTDVGLVNGLLESEGIATTVTEARNVRRNTWRAIQVLNEAQVARAREIVAHYLAGEPLIDPKSYRSWRCRACNELVEGQFQECWKCGAAMIS
jgi:hypothetical protein